MKKLLVTVNILLLMTMVSALFGAGKTSTVQFIFATTASTSVNNPVADSSVGINMHLSTNKTVPVGIKDNKSIDWIPAGEIWFSADITTTAPADQQYELKFYLINDTGDVPITSASPVNLASGATNKVKVVFQYPQVEFNLVKPPASHAGGVGITLHHATWSQSLGSKNDSYIDWIPVADYWFTPDETIQKEGIKLKFSYNGTEITQSNPVTFKSAQQYTIDIKFEKKVSSQGAYTIGQSNSSGLMKPYTFYPPKGENLKSISFTYGNKFLQLYKWDSPSGKVYPIPGSSSEYGMYQYKINTTKSSYSLSVPNLLYPNKSNLQTMSAKQYGNGANKDDVYIDYVYGFLHDIKINGISAIFDYKNSSSDLIKQDPENITDKVLSAYYANWSVYEFHRYFNIADMPLNYLNTVNYAFGALDPVNGSACIFDFWSDLCAPDSSQSGMPYLYKERLINPNLNVYYSIGGWGNIDYNNFQSGDFSLLFIRYPNNIEKLADSFISAMLKLGFNGIDIDYEWNAPVETKNFLDKKSPLGEKGSEIDWQSTWGPKPITTGQPGIFSVDSYTATESGQKIGNGYAQLIYFLSTKMAELNREKQPINPYKLSITISCGYEKINKLQSIKYNGTNKNIPANAIPTNIPILEYLMSKITYLNLMAYDMHGDFDAPLLSTSKNADKCVAGFQSGMDANPNSILPEPSKDYSINKALEALTNIDSKIVNKIVLGIPAYSRIEITKQQDAQSLGMNAQLATNKYQALNLGSGELPGDYWFQGSTNEKIAGYRGSGTFDYKDIVAAYLGKPYPVPPNNDKYSYQVYSEANIPVGTNVKQYFHGMSTPVTKGFGSYSKTPWFFNPNVLYKKGASKDELSQCGYFMSFDNSLSAAYKAGYIMGDNGNTFGELAGAMIWEIDGDVAPRGTMSFGVDIFQTYSLVYNVWRKFINKYKK